MKALDIGELNKIYDEAETVDKDVFAEQRSNVLLLAGEHYKKRDDRSTFRDPQPATESQKLRLVKNHVHKVVRHYVTSILSYAPGVQCTPFNETDLQDQKEAELNQSVIEAAKAEHRIDEKVRNWCGDFCGTGEVAVKIFWDPMAGNFLGYEPTIGESGQPLVDETGQLVADEDKPVFKGDFVFERIFAANLLRHAAAKDMREAQCWIIRKMVRCSELKAKYKNDTEKLKGIQESGEDEYVVFDSGAQKYSRTKDECLIREYYWRPCCDYPEGYFAIATGNVILEEGPLPYGVFPIAWAGFDEFPTSPRGRSIIKVARPYVAEINRASSSLALAQVTLGDDKVLYQQGTKLAPGALLPGVRGISYQGREPIILAGRDGSQYLPYIQSQIAEMYSVLMMDELEVEKNQNLDPYALLYRSAKQQTKYSLYAEKFQQFLIDVWTIYLELAKYYLPDDCLIPAIGRREMVNIAEFRATTPLRYQIKVVPREDTLETMLGKQLQQQNILQYVGKQLTRSDIGKLMKESPFGNNKEAFSDLTLDWEIAKNDMLALERGEWPPMSQYDDPDYMAKTLSARTRRPDFRFLQPQVQQLYMQRIQLYEQLIQKRQMELLQAEAEYIPTDGALVGCDFYVQDPNNQMAQPKRARIPQRALEWLIKHLEAQGASLQQLEQQNQGVVQEIAQRMLSNGLGAAGSGQIQPTAANGMPLGQVG